MVLTFGGGVVGDLGGFVASILLRGVPFVQVPTTLLAQVDASVGGKTGVNLDSGKNLLGTFHQPLLVFADLTTLATLEPRDLSSGLAEVVKHGAIADEALLGFLEGNAEAARRGDVVVLETLVARSVEIKAAIVKDDEREQTGRRALLNFGHTVGHAIESASQSRPNPLRHGEAIALGMLAACRVAERLGVSDPALAGRLSALLPRLGLPTDLAPFLGLDLGKWMQLDKKRSGATVQFVVVPRVGQARTENVTVPELVDALQP
jgi:3-dehydroquinate synthase